MLKLQPTLHTLLKPLLPIAGIALWVTNVCACSDASAQPIERDAGARDAGKPPAPSGVRKLSRSYLELAVQVAASAPGELTRLDMFGEPTIEGVGGGLLLNSELIEGGAFVEGTLPPEVEGGKTVGTSHGVCMHTGGDLALAPDQEPGLVGHCRQVLNLYGEGQVIVTGMIHQQAFEAGEPMVLAVNGGTGDLIGAYGQLTVTQITFPGILKQLDLDLRLPPEE